MGERRILFAVEEDAHVPSGGDEGNGVRLVVEKGAGPAGLVERALEQCVHVAAVDVQPDRIGIVPGEDRLLGARHVRTKPTDEAHVAVGRELERERREAMSSLGRSREIKGDRTWSASDGRMRLGQSREIKGDQGRSREIKGDQGRSHLERERRPYAPRAGGEV